MDHSENNVNYEETSVVLRRRMTIGTIAGLVVGSALVITDHFTHSIHPESFDIVVDVCGDLSLGCIGLVIAGILRINN